MTQTLYALFVVVRLSTPELGDVLVKEYIADYNLPIAKCGKMQDAINHGSYVEEFENKTALDRKIEGGGETRQAYCIRIGE